MEYELSDLETISEEDMRDLATVEEAESTW
jgi:hypothetical protein